LFVFCLLCYLPHLFTKFVRKSDRGTGLGLFIAKSIVEAHGGIIWAENNIQQKGAIFFFLHFLSQIKTMMRIRKKITR
jgi:signal transduction histidine kinase